MGALYLKDLADKTRRGLEGRIRQGRGVGRVSYGYRMLRRLRPDGEIDRGLREIEPAEAAILRRIFADYAAGHSPRQIAAALNAEGVPAPGGGIWFDSTIRGRPRRGDGLLRNPIYVGRLVWNRRRNLKDPTSGKLRRRENSQAELVVQAVPALRLIEEAVWEQVQARLAAEAAPPTQRPGQAAFWLQRRARHLLSGKVVCGACAAPFDARGKDYLGCRQARQGACRNRATLRRTPLEERVCQALGRQLMQPDLVAEFVAEFTAEWNRLAAEAGAAAESHRRELQGVERQLANLVDAIAEGLRAPGLQARFDALETRRAALEALVATTPRAVPALHPNLAQLYRARVAALHQAISAGDAPDALEAARALIDRVIIHPPEDGGGPPGVELVGDLLAMLRAAGLDETGDRDAHASGVLALFASSVKEGPGGRRPPGLAPAPNRVSSSPP